MTIINRYRDMVKMQRELVQLSLPPGDPEPEPESLWEIDSGYARYVGSANGSGPRASNKQRARRTATPKHNGDSDVLNVIDLGEVMRDGVEPPSMLVPNLIVAGGVPHRFSGPQACGKTWALLDACSQLIRRELTVIWVDLEMGRSHIAERLIALGAEADDVSNWFVYLDHGSLDCTEPSVAAWEVLVDEHKPELVVVDAQMEALASSDLSENNASDVLRWNNRYLDPALTRGCSTVLIDHTGHEDDSRARGSSAKGQASRVELLFKKVSDFDRQTIGRVEITVGKNALAAEIPKQQEFDLGGYVDETGEARFRWRSHEPTVLDEHDPRTGLGERILDVIAEIGPCSTNEWMGLVRGVGDKDKRDFANFLREAGRLRVERGARNALVWSVVEPDGDLGGRGHSVPPADPAEVTASMAGEGTSADFGPPKSNPDGKRDSESSATTSADFGGNRTPKSTTSARTSARRSKRKTSGRSQN